LQLLDDRGLVFLPRRIQAVFVEQHLAVLHPHLSRHPGRHLIDFLPQFGIERRLIQARKFFLQLDAEHFMRSHRDLAEIISTQQLWHRACVGAGAPARVYKSAESVAANKNKSK